MKNVVELIVKGRDEASGIFDGIASEAKQAQKTVSASAKRSGMDWEAAAKRIGKAGRSMVGVGSKLSLGLTTPLVAAGGAAIKAAVDAEETADKFDIVFKGQQDTMGAWLAKVREVIPASRAELQAMTADIGSVSKSLGATPVEAAKMSQSFVELAGDLGSFHNADPTQVLAAIRSGLVGSSEPLLQFGVDVRQAALEQIALKNGLIKTGEELKGYARQQAIAIAIQEQQSDAMGNAELTLNSTANQWKHFTADLKDASVTAGKILIPAFRQVTSVVGSVVSRFESASPTMQKVIVAVGALVAGVGPLLTILGTLAIVIGAIGLPVAAAVTGIAALTAGLVMAYRESETFRNIITGAVDAVRGFVTTALDELRQTWEVWGDEVTAVVSAFWNVISNVFLVQIEAVKSILGGALKIIGETFKLALNLLQGDWGAAWENVKAILVAGKDALIGVVRALWEGIERQFGEKIEAIKAKVTGFVNDVKEKFDWLAEKLTFGSIVPDMWDSISRQFDDGGSYVIASADGTAREVIRKVDGLQGKMDTFFGAKLHDWLGNWGTFLSAALDSFGGFGNALGGLVNKVGGFLGGLFGGGGGLGDILGGAGGFLDAIPGLGAIDNFLSGDIIGGALSFIPGAGQVLDMIPGLDSITGAVSDFVVGGIGDLIGGIGDVFGGMTDAEKIAKARGSSGAFGSAIGLFEEQFGSIPENIADLGRVNVPVTDSVRVGGTGSSFADRVRSTNYASSRPQVIEVRLDRDLLGRAASDTMADSVLVEARL